MSIERIFSESINLTDFDFTVERSRIMIEEPHDGSLTVRMPGDTRKTANHELIFIPYLTKHRLKFKTVAIGKGRKKKQSPIVVFDQHTLGAVSAPIRKYGKTVGIINSKGHALKILDIFNISVPAKTGGVVKLYFKLQPTTINEKKLNYHICTISLMKVVTDGKKDPAFKKKRLKKLPKREAEPAPPEPQTIL